RKKLLVMTGKSGACDALANNSLCGCAEVTLQNRKEAYEKELAASEFDLLVILELSYGQLVSAALGVPYGAEARPIVEALQTGIPVFAVREGLCTEQNICKSEKLKELYEAYVASLLSFGVKIISSKDIAAEIKKYCLHSEDKPETGKCILTDCKVITERLLTDETSANPDAVGIQIRSDSIVTPLAKDFILHRGLKVSIAKERCTKA
ncbi:MAG: hypothetical protein RR214_06910, partial [Synergistaceae bacterium]